MVGVLLARIGASKVPTSAFPHIFLVNLHLKCLVYCGIKISVPDVCYGPHLYLHCLKLMWCLSQIIEASCLSASCHSSCHLSQFILTGI